MGDTSLFAFVIIDEARRSERNVNTKQHASAKRMFHCQGIFRLTSTSSATSECFSCFAVDCDHKVQRSVQPPARLGIYTRTFSPN